MGAHSRGGGTYQIIQMSDGMLRSKLIKVWRKVKISNNNAQVMTYQNAKLNHHDDKHDTKTNNVLSCVKFTHRWNSNTPTGVYLKGADLSNWLRGRGFFGGGGGLFEGEGLIENLQNH